MAVGEILANPATGFLRIDERDVNINYSNIGTQSTNSNNHGGTYSTIQTNTEIKFNFVGSSIKLIGGSISSALSFKMFIDSEQDGKTYTCPVNNTHKVVFFEIAGLRDSEHSIIIKDFSVTFRMDAIDILMGKSLMPYRITIQNKILLSSGDKYYSLLNDGIQETTSIPKMTSSTTPEGEVLVSNSPNGNATFGWEAFDGGLSTNWGGNTLPGTMPKWIGYKFIKPKVIVKYRLYVTNTTYYPRNYEFQGSNDGINYDTLHSIVGGASGVLDYIIPNRKSYIYYRLYITSLSSGSTLPSVYELEMFEMKPSYLVQMESATESSFLDRGVEDINDFNQILKTKKNLIRLTTMLGSGKTFEHIIQMSKRRVDKITLG
ncbi:discoidin domain-containing protein [Paenibacillus sp. SAF-068]|uniref:discoidin domain-containing protein n=1 Tax=Paenibacillus sp. SAF-068 TaxID=3436864 RepID=UPI003F81317F